MCSSKEGETCEKIPHMTKNTTVVRLSVMILAAASVFAWFQLRPVVKAQDNLTPGMLFGPLTVAAGEHVELCAANLGEGDITALVHFRNLTTGDVTAAETLTVKSGGGACSSFYYGPGTVVGMARGEGRASDWVSPSNALISSMAVVNNKSTAAIVLGVPKLWLKGL